MNRKSADWIVEHRRGILILALILSVVCAGLMLRVRIVTDMTEYLPATSQMKQGVDKMAEEFADLSMPSTIRVMFGDLADEQKQQIADELRAMEDVTSVSKRESDEGSYTLYTVSTFLPYASEKETALETAIEERYADLGVVVRNDDTAMDSVVPLPVIATAIVILFVTLFVLCASWVEPFLFLGTIGIAIVLNMGTNIIQGSVSQTTYAIAALIQLVLSMDYSIILMSRYRQEKEEMPHPLTEEDRREAMKRALMHAFSSVASSGFTTVVGLLMLVFMRFRIGLDLGIVLGKGVFLSMVCVLTILPALILYFDHPIERLAKKVPSFPTGALASFSYRFRRPMALLFVALFVFAWVMQSRSDTSYYLSMDDPIAEVFDSSNPIVVLYGNEDEGKVGTMLKELEGDERVASVTSIATMTPDSDEDGGLLGGLLQWATKTALSSQLKGETCSLAVLYLDLPAESEDTTTFLNELTGSLDAAVNTGYYLVGESVMVYEMQQTFSRELLLITILTAASIFLVVLFTFRNVLIGLILVMIVQCGVYLTVMTTSIIGYDMYYLALLVVQCILMGATVDYGILFTNYYREMRRTQDIQQALASTYQHCLDTILTSAVFMILGTGAIGASPADPTIAQICQTISIGVTCTTLLILFVLPGMLGGLDRFIIDKKSGSR